MIEGSAQSGLLHLNGAIWGLIALGLAFTGNFDFDFFAMTGIAAGYFAAGLLSAREHYWPAVIPWIGAGLYFFSKAFENPAGSGWALLEGLPFLLLVLGYFAAGAGLSIYLEIGARNRRGSIAD